MSIFETISLVLISIVICDFMYKYIRRRKALNSYISSLKGKRVLITGATSGIGHALADELLGVGCRVILAGRDNKKLEKIKEELEKTKLPANDEEVKLKESNDYYISTVFLDLSISDTIVEAAKNIQNGYSKLGCVDVLINCGGISQRGSVIDTDVAVHKEIMDINYFGAVILTKELLPSMISDKIRRKHIVNISSLQGCTALPERSAYCASKHALQAFSDSLRAEMRSTGQNVGVIVVNPGYVHTNLSLNARTGDGSLHNKMDENTMKGYDPKYVAKEIIKSIIFEDEEVFIASSHHVVFIYLRRLMPALAMRIIEARAIKGLSTRIRYMIDNLFV